MTWSWLALVASALGVAAIVGAAAAIVVLSSRLRQARQLIETERQASAETLRHDRETAAALRVSVANESVILQNIDEIVFRVRPDGDSWTTDFVSPRVTDLLGYSPAELIAMGSRTIHPDDLPAMLEAIRAAFDSAGTRTVRFRIRHQNGEYRLFENRLRAVPPTGRSGATVFGVARDVTGRPAATGPAPPVEADDDAPPTVLVVDDEPGVRRLAAAMLRLSGYSVVEAGSGPEAEQVAGAYDGRIDILLTDIKMPGTRGPELADRIRMARPDIRVVYMSGFIDTGPLSDVERGEALFLPKPFVRSSLLGAVKRFVPASRVAM